MPRWKYFFIQQGAVDFGLLISRFALVLVVAAFGLASLRLLLWHASTQAIVKTTVAPSKRSEMAVNRHIWLDASLIGYAMGIGLQALLILLEALTGRFSPQIAMAPLENIAYFANLSDPSISVIFGAFSQGLEFLFAMSILAGLYAKYIRNFRVYLVFALIVSLIFPSANRYWQIMRLSLLELLFAFFSYGWW